jgi:hypothetical protein
MYFSAYKNEPCDYLLVEAGDTDITETSKVFYRVPAYKKRAYSLKISS